MDTHIIRWVGRTLLAAAAASTIALGVFTDHDAPPTAGYLYLVTLILIATTGGIAVVGLVWLADTIRRAYWGPYTQGLRDGLPSDDVVIPLRGKAR